MRLRYLHLPRCGPLTDTSVVFGREELISRTLEADVGLARRGALNFVVGVNGSGKSSILRTLYRCFRSLARRERPALPLTLAWDRRLDRETRTALLHISNLKGQSSFFATLAQVPSDAKRADWESLTLALADGQPHPLAREPQIEPGEAAVKGSLLFSQLPKRLIAYSSGAEDPWVQLDQPVYHPLGDETDLFPVDNEHPPGWTIEREWDKQLRQSSGPSQSVREKLDTNRMLGRDPLDMGHLRIRPPDLRLAGITLALWQTAKELGGRTGSAAQEALRQGFLDQCAAGGRPQDARRVLNEIDWFRPTHLSLVYRQAQGPGGPEQHREQLCLLALADAVVAQPGERMRAVISVGPSAAISLSERLGDVFPLGLPGSGLERIAERVDGAKTGAEAVLRIFSADQDIDSTPMDCFTRLREWQRGGLLDEATLTILRLHRPEAADGEPDDALVTYDQLSDGEQMLLGRMGIISLLRGQDGALLLMDEPETHFNDVWKREIVEMLDMGLLRSTEANVVVATHTSIALTDAFAAEVTVLDKNAGEITARGVSGGLFGTDPGEVNMNLFRADASTGRRSELILDRLLKTDWEGKETELEEILKVLGSSFHRAELRAILKRLRAGGDGSSSG